MEGVKYLKIAGKNSIVPSGGSHDIHEPGTENEFRDAVYAAGLGSRAFNSCLAQTVRWHSCMEKILDESGI
jgi:hypothetical protein